MLRSALEQQDCPHSQDAERSPGTHQAYAYLSALESGHWGMTTVHADNADQARGRICGLIKKHPSGRHLNDADVMVSLQRTINVVVHCARDGNRRFIEQVLYEPVAQSASPDATQRDAMALAAE